MRVLLTTLPSPFLDDDRAFPQLGILYLLSAAKAAGHDVTYLRHPADSCGDNKQGVYYTDNAVLGGHGYASYDAVAISAVTPQGGQARELLNNLKHPNPMFEPTDDKLTVIIGGPHATHYWKECVDAGFDHVIRGDGERWFVNFLEGKVKAERSVYQRTMKAREMNRMPPPLREAEYLQNYGHYTLLGRPATSMIVSRGCGRHCAFCEDGTSPARWYTPEHFEQQVLDVKAAGFEAVMIYDDLFAISSKKVRPYAEILQKHGVIYRCFTHARSVWKDRDLAYVLADTGCVAVGFGAESMDDGILETINKRTTGQMNQYCVDIMQGVGINVKSFFMLGLPGETRESAQKMHDFIERNRSLYPELYDFDQASIFFPFKGTEIGDSLRAGETRYDLKLIDGLTWEEVDRKCLGAHKAADGDSEHITETSGLSCDDLRWCQIQIKKLSKRFEDGRELKEGVYE